VLYWDVNIYPKSKDLTRKKFPTLVGKNFPSYHWVEFTQTRGDYPLTKDISSARKGYIMKTKVKASEWNNTLNVFVENAIESGMVALELSGVLESKTDKQIAVIEDNLKSQATDKFLDTHEVKGGTHADCLTSEASAVYHKEIIPAITKFNDLSIEQGKTGKGGCELDLRPNFKVIKLDDSSDDAESSEVE